MVLYSEEVCFYLLLIIFINDLDFDLSDGFHGRIFQKNQWVQQWILGLGRWRWWYLASNVWRLQAWIYSIIARIEYGKYEILVRKVFERDLSCDEIINRSLYFWSKLVEINWFGSSDVSTEISVSWLCHHMKTLLRILFVLKFRTPQYDPIRIGTDIGTDSFANPS